MSVLSEKTTPVSQILVIHFACLLSNRNEIKLCKSNLNCIFSVITAKTCFLVFTITLVRQLLVSSYTNAWVGPSGLITRSKCSEKVCFLSLSLSFLLLSFPSTVDENSMWEGKCKATFYNFCLSHDHNIPISNNKVPKKTMTSLAASHAQP